MSAISESIYPAQSFDLSGVSLNQELWTHPFKRPYSRGQVAITCISNPTGFDIVCADLQVLGFEGSNGDVVFRTALDINGNSAVFKFGDEFSYDRIAVWGRKLINGVESTSTPVTLQVSLWLKLWSDG